MDWFAKGVCAIFVAARSPCFITLALLLSWSPGAAAQSYGPNLVPWGNFENVLPTYVPWAGVDAAGNIHGLEGTQLSVGDDGSIRGHKFGPAIAAGDLNGDGKQDLVLADSKGFFWFFPNSGTAQRPAFTQGEVIPVWLGEKRTSPSTEGIDDVVPRIQLIDLNNSNKLDLVAGTYAGKLFRFQNLGSSLAPVFKMANDPASQIIDTRRNSVLWCNYLSPFFTNLFGSATGLDLIMGDGSYSANSIYWLHNTGSPRSPSFDEDHRQKIIPGMGLEQLTPVVLDWNNDGKPDILTGDRTGYLTLYLNTSTDPDRPTFAAGTHVKIAGVEKLGNATTLALGDLTGNHLPNLLIGRDDGTILYALNTGKPGSPVFNTPATPVKGILPANYHYVSSKDWFKAQAYGVPYELLSCVNPQLEPGFTFPEGEKSRYALKFSVWPVKSVIFPDRFYPAAEDYYNEHVISAGKSFTLKLNVRYRLHFWVKGSSPNLRVHLNPVYIYRTGYHAPSMMLPVSTGGDWTEFSSEVKASDPDDPTVTTWPYIPEFRFTGQSTLYFDDLTVEEEL